MYSIYEHKSHQFKDYRIRTYLQKIPNIFLIFDNENNELLIIDPTDSGKEPIEIDLNLSNIIDYNEIFSLMFEEIKKIKNKIDYEWLNKNLIIYVSHGHPDHYMGIVNSSFKAICINEIKKIPIFIHRKTLKYINNQGKILKEAYDLLEKIYSNGYVSFIKKFCNLSVGKFEPLKVPIKKLKYLKLKKKWRNFKHNLFFWNGNQIHGGHGLRLKFKNNSEEKNSIFLYDLYPPSIPFSTSLFPNTNLNNLVDIYKNLEDEISKEKIDMIYWSHFKELYGDGNCCYKDKDLIKFKNEILKFIEIIKNIEERYLEYRSTNDGIKREDIVKFCREIAKDHIKDLFPKYTPEVWLIDKEKINYWIDFHYDNVQSEIFEYDGDRLIIGEERKEIPPRPFILILLFNIIILNIIFNNDKDLLKSL